MAVTWKKLAYETDVILKSVLTTRGDIIYRNATVPARLAKGTAGYILTMGADEPAWAAQITHALTAGATDVTATYGELNILDDATLTTAELNLMDLSAQSVIAGELLVGTGNGTAAWQKTGVILTAPTLNGTTTLGSTPIFDVGSGYGEFDTTGIYSDKAGLQIHGSHVDGGPAVVLQHDHTTPDNNRAIGAYMVYDYDHDGTPALQRFGMMLAIHTNIGDGTEAMKWEWYGMTGGVPDNIAMSLSGAGALWVDGSITLDANETVDGIDVSAHDVATTGVHGAGANTILYSDHAALTTAHGAVSAATASKIVVRDAEGQAKFAAPAASGDALIKGTRVTTAELPAMTDEYYWVGTGTNVEERAVPEAGAPTKEFFAVPTVALAGGTLTVRGDFAGAELTGANDYCILTFKVPHDFSSIVSAEIIVIPIATQAEADWDITSDYAAVGEGRQTHQGSDTASTYNVTAEELFNINISGVLGDLTADDYVGIKFTNKNDAHDVLVLGVRFRYS